MVLVISVYDARRGGGGADSMADGEVLQRSMNVLRPFERR